MSSSPFSGKQFAVTALIQRNSSLKQYVSLVIHSLSAPRAIQRLLPFVDFSGVIRARGH